MKRFLSVLLILATLLAICSCGGTKDEPTQPQVDGEAEKAQLAAKYRFIFTDTEDSPKNEAELEEYTMSMIGSIVSDGNMYLQVHCQNDDVKAVKDFFSSKEISYNNPIPSMGMNYVEGVITTEMLDIIDNVFLLALADIENVTKIKVRGDLSEKYTEALNVKTVAYLNGESENVYSPRDLQNWLDRVSDACMDGEAYDGMGVYLHGFEVQKSDLTGIPYCHISYGTKENPMTVLGFGHDVIAELDAALVADMLSICPYFTLVEFFAVQDANSPTLNK